MFLLWLDSCPRTWQWGLNHCFSSPRKWQPTTVFLPGKSHGRRSLGGCSPWGRKESDMTEQLHFSSPTHWGQAQSYWHSVFPPCPFSLPSFVWFCMFFFAGQVLLSTPSWCSACTSVSEGVFLMYEWREMYSTSTHSTSAILFSPECWV